jgi:UDP-N-acetylmuramoyl-L-alanyl-D-glutamate--2,6-diaminopimelate ligase
VLPPYRRGAKAPSAAQLAELLIAELKRGDVIMVKGSFGSRMGQVVEALKALGGRNAV